VRVAFVDRPVCLPVCFSLWRPRRKDIAKSKPDPERPSKPRLARGLVGPRSRPDTRNAPCMLSATPATHRVPDAACPRV
jgi:hypothetical protein